ncbi:MAG: DUF6056 family protein [Treponema sp.]|jgi:hypothetical protein|nr:DUF6056 family protein [Treponema sp.]
MTHSHRVPGYAAKAAAKRMLITVLPVALPVIVFFLFNALTPFWWDGFVMACFFGGWYDPHTRLLERFNDVVLSTFNIYKTWHGRTFADFFNFLFMFFKDKTLFNICNTVVYALCTFLMCFHVAGSVKNIRPPLFLCVTILLWLFLPQWGQNLLWLTGSCNYLWTTTAILAFLIPFRKHADNPVYTPHSAISMLWLFMGLLSGWSMENSASGLFVLLIAYFIAKAAKKERVCFFEMTGAAGFTAGFFMLLRARHNPFPGFWGMVKNAVQVFSEFLRTDWLLLGLIILLGIKLVVFRKRRIANAVYGYGIAAMSSVAAMVLPGYFGGRSCFITQVFLIIGALSLCLEMLQYVPKKYMLYSCSLVLLLFLPSFYEGTKSIVESYFLSAARERYILSEKENGNTHIRVKSPIVVDDPHSGLYGGIDILSDPNNREYITHNSAKVTWYGINSLDGISANNTGGSSSLTATIKYYIQRRKRGNLKTEDLFKMIYEHW